MAWKRCKISYGVLSGPRLPHALRAAATAHALVLGRRASPAWRPDDDLWAQHLPGARRLWHRPLGVAGSRCESWRMAWSDPRRAARQRTTDACCRHKSHMYMYLPNCRSEASSLSQEPMTHSVRLLTRGCTFWCKGCSVGRSGREVVASGRGGARALEGFRRAAELVSGRY